MKTGSGSYEIYTYNNFHELVQSAPITYCQILIELPMQVMNDETNDYYYNECKKDSGA